MLVEHLCQVLARWAPLNLAESWDNVGLLIGDRRSAVRNVMTCLTVTPGVVDEAIAGRVNFLVSHHPLPFKPLGRITTDSQAGQMVWRLAGAGIHLYSAHTAYDSAAAGINDQWATAMGLTQVRPIQPIAGVTENDASIGVGRFGLLAQRTTAAALLHRAAEFCGSTRPRWTGDPARPIHRLGIACGSGGGFIGAARRVGCEALLTGEATFHQCLEAENAGIAILLVGHHASERFAMVHWAERLAAEIAAKWPDFAGTVSTSQADVDVIAVEGNAITVDPV